MITIVYGPQRCGKSKNAARIAEALDCTVIWHSWPKDIDKAKVIAAKQEVLLLVNEVAVELEAPRRVRRIMPYETAMEYVAKAEK